MVLRIALALALLSSLTCALVAQESNGATTTTAGSISGRVTDALGEGVPMADVSVLGWSDRDRSLARGITDASGMFVIRGVPLRDSPYWLDVVAADRQGGLAVARLSETARESWTGIRVWDAATVDVLVVDEDGRPVEGASVFARSRFGRLFVAHSGAQVEARTDATGHARLANVPIGAIVVGAWCSGHDLANTSLHLNRGARVEFRLAASDGVRLELLVDGLAEGTEVAWDLWSPTDDGPLLPRSLMHGTTRGGKATIAGLPDAKWMLRLAGPGHGLSPSQIELEPGEAVHMVHVTAAPPGTVGVRGTLRDASGRPLADRTLGCRAVQSAVTARTRTDDAGRFTLAPVVAPGEEAIAFLLDGEHVLAQAKDESHRGFRDARFLAHHEFVAAETTDLELVAVKAARIGGRVCDQKGGGVAGRRVELEECSALRSPRWSGFASATTDRDGRFALRALRAPGGSRDDLALVVENAARVHGTVRDANGRPLPGAFVRLEIAEGERAGSMTPRYALADRMGRFVVPDVDTGRYRLAGSLDDDDAWDLGNVVELLPGTDLECDVRIGR